MGREIDVVPQTKTVHVDVAFLEKLAVGHEGGEKEWVRRVPQPEAR
jgi:hypothetical protein